MKSLFARLFMKENTTELEDAILAMFMRNR